MLPCRSRWLAGGAAPRRFLRLSISALLLLVFSSAASRTLVSAVAQPIPTAVPASPALYRLPWSGGMTFTCVQGNNGSFSHFGAEAYAWDFAMPVGTVITAARAGTVRFVSVGNDTGGPSWQYAPDGNDIVVDHGDGTSGLYLHLMYHGALVSVGQSVTQGQPLGYSGETGFASAPHLHFMVEHTDPVSAFSQSIPARFTDVAANNGVPVQDAAYTSGNATVAVTQAATIYNISNAPPLASQAAGPDASVATGGALLML